MSAELPAPDVRGFHDATTGTVSYVVADLATGQAALIDAVLDYDPKSGRTRTISADRLLADVAARGLRIAWVLETHVHADHLSAMPYIRGKIGGVSGIGDQLPQVQEAFRRIFNAERDFHPDGRQFDHLFADGAEFKLGDIAVRVLHTPGHTPACVTYLIGDAAFVGDTLFMPDYGTARCDFPGGDAATLYRSIQKIFALPPRTRLFMCHDYPPPSRAAMWQSSVAEQMADNIHVHRGVSEADFVAMREARDATLEMPVLILPAVQVNMRAGELPPAENNGVHYLKIPVNLL